MRRVSIAIIYLLASTLPGCGGIGGSIASSAGGNIVGGIAIEGTNSGGAAGHFSETPKEIRAQGRQGALVLNKHIEPMTRCAVRELDQVSAPFKYINKVESLSKGQSATIAGAVWRGGSSYVIDFKSNADQQSVAEIYLAKNVIMHREVVLQSIRKALSRCAMIVQ